MREFKNLLFDFGGVILELELKKCIDEFIRLGCPPQLFEGEFWSEGIFRRVDRGTATESEFYDEVRRIGKIPHATDDEILHAWNCFIPRVHQEAFEALKTLKERYPLYMLSNSNQMHWRECHAKQMQYEGEDAFNWFKRVFVSFEMHLEKPELEIYQRVALNAGIRAEDTLFIDDRQENLDAAAKVGFQTLLTKDFDWIEKLVPKN